MTKEPNVGPETVEAVGYEHDDGTLYGYANHVDFKGNPGGIPVRIMRESDYQALRSQLTASEKPWQPIETAPSNMTVLVSGFATEAYTELPTDKRWLVVAVKLDGHWYRSYTDGSQNGAELLPPTHWMRKPEDPS